MGEQSTGAGSDTEAADEVDLTDAEVVQDPYPFFAARRGSTPVFRSEALDAWVVTRYDQVEAIVTDHQRFSNAAAIHPPPGLDPAAGRLLEGFGWRPNFDTDPPEHTRIRQAVMQAFTARRVAALEDRIRRVAHELIDGIEQDHQADMVTAYCLPLPARVIFGMLGVPDEDLDRVHHWTSRFIELYVAQIVDGHDVARAEDCVAYWEYCLDLIAERAAAPGDDLISGLVLGTTEGGAMAVEPPLTPEEIASIGMLLVVAGHETTANLLGNLLRHLLADPGRWEAVRRDPALLPSATEEALRLDAPVQVLHRVTTCPVTLDGMDLPAGAKVLIPFGAANHDEGVFDDPDTFDLHRRRASRHLAFSKGVHHCLGAPLARLEARVALEVLAERLPGLRLGDREIRYRPIFSIRSLESLHVVW